MTEWTIKRTYRNQNTGENDGNMAYYHVFDSTGLQIDSYGFRYKRDAEKFRAIVQEDGEDAARAWERG